MVKKSKLLSALDAEKGRDYEAEKRKKQVKAAEKRKRSKVQQQDQQAGAKAEQQVDDDEEKENIQIGETSIQKELKSILKPTGKAQEPPEELQQDENVNDEDEEETDTVTNGGTILQPTEAGEVSASEAEQESDVPMSDLEDEDLEDVIPHQRMTINNGPALLASRKRVTIAKPAMPFHYHNSLISSLPPAAEAIPDAMDDLTRESEFYRIARDAVVAGRALLKKEKIPFTRPSDYFAEMVKSEEHMGKIKQKLYDQAADKKGREEARRVRDAKKFGKQVQVAKEQERAKEKRDTLDKIKDLKRKRKGNTSSATTEADDLFQEIAVENDGPPSKRPRDASSSGTPSRGGKRQQRDTKFGFGGRKRFAKSGDAMSSGDISAFSASGMKRGRGGRGGGRGGASSSRGRGGARAGGGGARGGRGSTRLGKSRRAAGRD